MILVSGAIRDAKIFWIVKQAVPPFIIASFLAMGICIFDKFRIPYLPCVDRVNGARGVVFFSLVGLGVWCVCVTAMWLSSSGFKSNNVHETLPALRFYPYLALTIIFSGFIQPVLEEIIFRGRIFPIASGVVGVPVAVLIVSSLFCLLHYSHMGASFFFSIIMCVVALRHGVRACIISHAAYNLASIMIDAF